MNILVFLGSVRDSTPPRPARLGARVASACAEQLAPDCAQVDIIDPLTLELAPPFKPQFAYAAGRAPNGLDQLAAQIDSADGFVMVSPEYNHSMSPALADTLNHFGSSLFSFKPSLIVTYSAGQWGGTRAAVNMRTFLAELGCLPVSAMIHVPRAHEVFQDDGNFAPGIDADKWRGYMGRGVDQLLWWAAAARHQRTRADGTAAFVKDPSQRNAP